MRPGQLRLIGWGILALAWLILSGCAEVTKPAPTRAEVASVQVAALTRHPQASYQKERAMRVFLRLLPTLPRIHGRTYPFLGFNWWVTEAGQPVVDAVWAPSPARDRPLKGQAATLLDPDDERSPPPDQEAALKPGDLILAVNGMSIPTWVKEWDQASRTLKQVLRSSLPGEFLVNLVLTACAAREEMAGRYRGGPVTLLVDRQGARRQVTLYPVYLPAEYGLLLVTGQAGNAFNAFAAPGCLMITRAMLEMCRTDDELAIVLGHELAHLAKGHLVRRQAYAPVSQLVADIIALPFKFFWPNSAWYYGVSEDIRRVASGAVISVFSRQDEWEADAYGLWYAYQAGYAVDQGVMIWERLAVVVQQNVFETTYYLDAHPAAAARLARLKKMARLFQEGQAAQVLVP